MTEEYPGEVYVRNTDPDTSHAAAASLRGRRASEIDMKLVAAIRAAPNGMTSLEASIALGMDRVSVSPRFAPLRRLGLLYGSGLRRRGPKGRSGIVWKATERNSEDE